MEFYKAKEAREASQIFKKIRKKIFKNVYNEIWEAIKNGQTEIVFYEDTYPNISNDLKYLKSIGYKIKIEFGRFGNIIYISWM